MCGHPCVCVPVWISRVIGPPGDSPRAHWPPASSLRELAGVSPPVFVAPYPGKFNLGPNPLAFPVPQRWSADFQGSLAGNRASCLSLLPGLMGHRDPAFPCPGAWISGTLLGSDSGEGVRCALLGLQRIPSLTEAPVEDQVCRCTLELSAARSLGPRRAWGRCQTPEIPGSFSMPFISPDH